MIKYSSASFVIGPLLLPYFFPGTTINLETIFMTLNAVVFFYYLYVKRKNTKIQWPAGYKLFLLYAMVCAPFLGIFLWGEAGGIVSSYHTLIPFSFCLILGKDLVDLRLLKKYFRLVVYAACIVFVIQDLSYAAFGWRPSFLLPILPVSYANKDMGSVIANQMLAPRSMSFFLEPAHFAQYITAYLAMVLGDNCRKKKLCSVESILFSLVLLFTWSGNAVMFLIALYGCFLIKIKFGFVKKCLIVLPICAIAALLSFSLISKTEKGKALLERQQETKVNQERVSSGEVRLYRGYFVFGGLSTTKKVIGVGGSGYCEQTIEKSTYLWMFYSFERYLNTTQTLLIGYGIIGTILFLLFVYKNKNKNQYSPFLSIAFIAMIIMESCWCHYKMLLFMEPGLIATDKTEE